MDEKINCRKFLWFYLKFILDTLQNGEEISYICEPSYRHPHVGTSKCKSACLGTSRKDCHQHLKELGDKNDEKFSRVRF